MTDEEIAAIAQIRADAENQDYANAVRFVLASPLGRAFVWEQMTRCGTFGGSFTGEALSSAFNEGKRHIGTLALIDIQRVDRTAWITMEGEHLARQERYDAMKPTPEGDTP